MIYQNSHSIAH